MPIPRVDEPLREMLKQLAKRGCIVALVKLWEELFKHAELQRIKLDEINLGFERLANGEAIRPVIIF